MTTGLSRRQRMTIGALPMALGAGVSLAIHFHLLCRVGFGLAALLGLFILVLIIRPALKPWR